MKYPVKSLEFYLAINLPTGMRQSAQQGMHGITDLVYNTTLQMAELHVTNNRVIMIPFTNIKQIEFSEPNTPNVLHREPDLHKENKRPSMTTTTPTADTPLNQKHQEHQEHQELELAKEKELVESLNRLLRTRKKS